MLRSGTMLRFLLFVTVPPILLSWIGSLGVHGAVSEEIWGHHFNETCSSLSVSRLGPGDPYAMYQPSAFSDESDKLDKLEKLMASESGAAKLLGEVSDGPSAGLDFPSMNGSTEGTSELRLALKAEAEANAGLPIHLMLQRERERRAQEVEHSDEDKGEKGAQEKVGGEAEDNNNGEDKGENNGENNGENKGVDVYEEQESGGDEDECVDNVNLIQCFVASRLEANKRGCAGLRPLCGQFRDALTNFCCSSFQDICPEIDATAQPSSVAALGSPDSPDTPTSPGTLQNESDPKSESKNGPQSPQPYFPKPYEERRLLEPSSVPLREPLSGEVEKGPMSRRLLSELQNVKPFGGLEAPDRAMAMSEPHAPVDPVVTIIVNTDKLEPCPLYESMWQLGRAMSLLFGPSPAALGANSGTASLSTFLASTSQAFTAMADGGRAGGPGQGSGMCPGIGRMAKDFERIVSGLMTRQEDSKKLGRALSVWVDQNFRFVDSAKLQALSHVPGGGKSDLTRRALFNTEAFSVVLNDCSTSTMNSVKTLNAGIVNGSPGPSNADVDVAEMLHHMSRLFDRAKVILYECGDCMDSFFQMLATEARVADYRRIKRRVQYGVDDLSNRLRNYLVITPREKLPRTPGNLVRLLYYLGSALRDPTSMKDRDAPARDTQTETQTQTQTHAFAEPSASQLRGLSKPPVNAPPPLDERELIDTALIMMRAVYREFHAQDDSRDRASTHTHTAMFPPPGSKPAGSTLPGLVTASQTNARPLYHFFRQQLRCTPRRSLAALNDTHPNMDSHTYHMYSHTYSHTPARADSIEVARALRRLDEEDDFMLPELSSLDFISPVSASSGFIVSPSVVSFRSDRPSFANAIRESEGGDEMSDLRGSARELKRRDRGQGGKDAVGDVTVSSIIGEAPAEPMVNGASESNSDFSQLTPPMTSQATGQAQMEGLTDRSLEASLNAALNPRDVVVGINGAPTMFFPGSIAEIPIHNRMSPAVQELNDAYGPVNRTPTRKPAGPRLERPHPLDEAAMNAYRQHGLGVPGTPVATAVRMDGGANVSPAKATGQFSGAPGFRLPGSVGALSLAPPAVIRFAGEEDETKDDKEGTPNTNISNGGVAANGLPPLSGYKCADDYRRLMTDYFKFFLPFATCSKIIDTTGCQPSDDAKENLIPFPLLVHACPATWLRQCAPKVSPATLALAARRLASAPTPNTWDSVAWMDDAGANGKVTSWSGSGNLDGRSLYLSIGEGAAARAAVAADGSPEGGEGRSGEGRSNADTSGPAGMLDPYNELHLQNLMASAQWDSGAHGLLANFLAQLPAGDSASLTGAEHPFKPLQVCLSKVQKEADRLRARSGRGKSEGGAGMDGDIIGRDANEEEAARLRETKEREVAGAQSSIFVSALTSLSALLVILAFSSE